MCSLLIAGFINQAIHRINQSSDHASSARVHGNILVNRIFLLSVSYTGVASECWSSNWSNLDRKFFRNIKRCDPDIPVLSWRLRLSDYSFSWVRAPTWLVRSFLFDKNFSLNIIRSILRESRASRLFHFLDFILDIPSSQYIVAGKFINNHPLFSWKT